MDIDTKIEYMNLICKQLRIQLREHQLQLITLFDVYNLIVRSARQVGETTALVIALALKLLAGEKVLVLSDTMYEHDDMLNKLFAILAGVYNSNHLRKINNSIQLHNGGSLTLQPFRPESFMGKQYDAIVLFNRSRSADKIGYTSEAIHKCKRVHLFSNYSLLGGDIPPETIELYMRH